MATSNAETSNAPGNSTSIETLSNELLTMILEYATMSENARDNHCAPLYNRRDQSPLMLVNRRFFDLTRKFSQNNVQPSWLPDSFSGQILDLASWERIQLDPLSCQRLRISWKQDAMLPRFVRRVEETKELVDIMRNVRCFEFLDESIGAHWSARYANEEEKFAMAWGFFKDTVRSFDRLQHLTVKHARLCDVVPACGLMPTLKKLELIEVLEGDNHFQLSPTQYRNASFTTLRIELFRDTRRSLLELLNWPKTLVNFEFGDPDFEDLDWYASVWDIRDLSRILESQKETLENVHTGTLAFDYEGPVEESWLIPKVILHSSAHEPDSVDDNGEFKVGTVVRTYMDRYFGAGIRPLAKEPFDFFI